MAPKLLEALIERRLDGVRDPSGNRGLSLSGNPSISGEVEGETVR
jgi:hypothetical protein